MSAPDSASLRDGIARWPWRPPALAVVLTLLLAVVMMRPPLPMAADPETAYRTALYETLRLGHAWGETFATTDGPLAAAQTPGYASGSIWMAMVWQIGGNLLLAALVVGAAWRLPRTRRVFALALLGATLGRFPALAPWLTIVLLGVDLIRRREGTPAITFVTAGTLAFFGLSSLGHLLLGATAVLIACLPGTTTQRRVAAGGGFVTAVILGWLAVGQSPGSLVSWLGSAFPAVWNTSPLWRIHDLAELRGWAAAAGCTLAIGAAFFVSSPTRREFLPATVFLLIATALAWKTQVLQPFGQAGVFFVTVVAAAFVLLHIGARTIIGVVTAAIALAGLNQWQPLVLIDGLGHFNRQFILNVRMVAALPELRTSLQGQVRQLRSLHDLPDIRNAVGEGSVDVLGGWPSHALLNTLRLQSRPAPFTALVRTPALAERNRQSLAGPEAPDFVIQRIQPAHGLAPAFEDPSAQLELYRRYSVIREENGFFLWRQRPPAGEPSAPIFVTSGMLEPGEALSLPHLTPGTAHWLELDLRPGVFGWLWSLLDEVAEPGLLVRDDQGRALNYPLLPSLASGGFIVAPFIRGEPDMIRFQSGTAPGRIITVTVTPPPSGRWLRPGRIPYRLYSIPGITLQQEVLPTDSLQRFSLLNREPIAVATTYPISVLPDTEEGPAMFTHPDSVIEFAVTPDDRRVRGAFGILPGAYANRIATDGVDFAVEFIAEDGRRTSLLHRYLDPLYEATDRGRQNFVIDLPEGKPGRLLLRTYNPPHRQQAWDWAYWGPITIEPAP